MSDNWFYCTMSVLMFYYFFMADNFLIFGYAECFRLM